MAVTALSSASPLIPSLHSRRPGSEQTPVGTDIQPWPPTSAPIMSQASRWVLYKYGPHNNLGGR